MSSRFKNQVLKLSLWKGLATFLLVFCVSMSGNSALAGKDCVSCLSPVTDDAVHKRSALCCKNNHVIDRSCLVRQLGSVECFEEVMDLGLPCGGLVSGGAPCDERFSLSKISHVLHQRQRKALKKRIALASAPMAPAQFEAEVTQLKRRIQDSFVLSCPIEGCGNALDRIEGCNAAKCSHYLCRETFCYLCLAKQSSLSEAHAHVRDVHSGDFWEYRPGYSDRYHWLLIRDHLTDVFRLKVHSDVKTAAVDQLKPLLVENKMWPFPAGIRLADWIKELQSSELNPQQKVEILQNEAIHRLNSGDVQGFETIEHEIKALGGTVLRTLDNPSSTDSFVPEEGLFHFEPGQFYVPQLHYAPYMHGDGRGDVFRTPNWERDGYVIWGPLFCGEGDLRYAREKCQMAGGRLPTQKDLWALARTLGARDPAAGNYEGFDASLLPDMDSEDLWGFTPIEDEFAYVIEGRVYAMEQGTGVVIDETDSWGYSSARFRCVY